MGILNKIRQKGIVCSLKKIISVSATFALDKRVSILYEKDLNLNAGIDSASLDKDMIFIIYSDINQLGINAQLQLENTGEFEKEEIRNRFLGGNLCFLVKDRKNSIVHYSWICFKKRYIDLVKKSIQLDKSEAFIDKCYTFQEYRGLSIYPAMLVKIQEYLKRNGFEKVYIDVNMKNSSSIKGIVKAGFSPKSEFMLLVILRVFEIFKEAPLQFLNQKTNICDS